MRRSRLPEGEPRLGPSTFTDLYGQQHRALTRFFVARTFDPEAAVDLVGETFAQAFAGRRRFRGRTPDEEVAFLFGIARHLLAGYYRRGYVERRGLRRLGIDRSVLDDESLARIEELADVGGMRELVRAELRALSADHREALRLRVVEELDYPDVASAMGVSEPTARARVSRALRALGARLPRAVEGGA